MTSNASRSESNPLHVSDGGQRRKSSIRRMLNDSADVESGSFVQDMGFKTRLKIVRVNDVDEKWEGIFEVFFHYPLPESVAPAVYKDEMDFAIISKPEKHPEFLIMNDDSSETTEEVYFRCKQSPGNIFGFIEYKVTMHERLELPRFPFDRQNFSFQFNCANSTLVPWFSEFIPEQISSELGSAANNIFIGQCDSESWRLDRLVISQPNPSGCILKLGMTREPSFYIMNIVFPIFMIVQVATLTVGIEPADFGSRFAAMLTLLLTIVAFKFVTAGFVPKVSYQTFLDMYTNVAYIFLAVMMLENFFVSSRFLDYPEEKDDAEDIDDAVAAIYTVAWVFIHAVILVGSKLGWFQASWEETDAGDAFVKKESSITHDKFM